MLKLFTLLNKLKLFYSKTVAENMEMLLFNFYFVIFICKPTLTGNRLLKITAKLGLQSRDTYSHVSLEMYSMKISPFKQPQL